MGNSYSSIRLRLWHVKRFLKVLPSALFGKVFFVTGIPRSGSTLVYNIVRLLLSQTDTKDCRANWINDFVFKPKFGEKVVLKLHEYDWWLSKLPASYIHTSRNLLEVASSTAKKNGEVPKIERVKEFQEWDKRWRKRADIFIKYTEIGELEEVISRLAKVLEVSDYDSKALIDELEGSGKNEILGEYDSLTLYQPAHKSGAGNQWQEILPVGLQKEIQKLQDV